MSWIEFFAYAISNQAVPAGNGTAFATTNLRIDSDADFEWHKSAYQVSQANIRLRFRDESTGMYNTKNDVDLRNVAGNFAGTPFILPRPQIIPAGGNLGIDVADASGLANTLRFVLIGGKRRAGACPWKETVSGPNGDIMYRNKFRGLRPFIFTTGLVAVGANATAAARIEIDKDAHFLVQKITGTRQGGCLIEFKGASRDEYWQNIPLHFDTVVGNGQFPMIMFAERMVRKMSVISIQIQDISGAANVVEINLHGVKMYE